MRLAKYAALAAAIVGCSGSVEVIDAAHGSSGAGDGSSSSATGAGGAPTTVGVGGAPMVVGAGGAPPSTTTGSGDATATSTGADTTGAGGAGGGFSCTPDAQASCVCPDGGSGVAICTPDGSALGPCLTCGDDKPWSRAFEGGYNFPDPASLVMAPDNTLVAVWRWFDDNEPEPYVGAHVAKFNPGGGTLWDHPADTLASAALAPDGSVIVGGYIYNGAAQLLGASVSCSATHCGIVGKLGDDGLFTWFEVLDPGVGASAEVVSVGVGGDGRIFLAGMFNGTLDLGSGLLDGGAPDKWKPQQIFVAGLTPQGGGLWSRSIAGEAPMFKLLSAAVDPAGDIALTGYTSKGLDFGAGLVPAQTSPYGNGLSGFIAVYGSAGDLHYGKLLGSEWESYLTYTRVALDFAGNALLLVDGRDTFDFGGGPSVNALELGVQIAKLDPAGGFLWSHKIGNTWYGLPYAITSDAAGDVWLCGSSLTNMVFDGVPIPFDGTTDVMIYRYDASGAPKTLEVLGGITNQGGMNITIGPSGVPVIAGLYGGEPDFGAGPLPSPPPNMDYMFIAKRGP